MTCRYDKAAEDYLTPDGEPCRNDEYGDPTRHCTARRTCSVHIGRDELTCPRCIGRTRADIAWVVNLVALMPVEALSRGVDSEPTNLAGPAADPVVTSWRRINAANATGGLIGDGIEELAPTEVLGAWQRMVSEDYGHDLPDRVTLATAAGYLDRNLARIANDPGQDWPLMVRDIRKCRSHLEAVLRNGRGVERGAPCPDCTSGETGVGARLVRQYGHWCDDPACTKFNYEDDREDRWVCPRNREHQWTHEDYSRWIETRKAKTA